MPIRIDYSPVPTALNLAKIAGEGKAKESAFAQDLALIQLGFQQQQQQLQAQAQEQAFQLQQAAAAAQAQRVSQTPTSRQQTVPNLSESASLMRFGMETGLKQQAQDAQLGELNNSLQMGLIDPQTYELNRLRILGGQAVEFPKPAAEAKPPVSIRMLPFQTQITQLQDERKSVSAWLQDPTLDEQTKTHYQNEATRIDKQIATVAAQAQAAFGITPASGATPSSGVEAPPPMKGDHVGQVKVAPDGTTRWVWLGSDWAKVTGNAGK